MPSGPGALVNLTRLVPSGAIECTSVSSDPGAPDPIIGPGRRSLANAILPFGPGKVACVEDASRAAAKPPAISRLPNCTVRPLGTRRLWRGALDDHKLGAPRTSAPSYLA